MDINETLKMEQNKIIPLSAIKSGEKVKLTGVEAGRGLNSRLAAMGLLPNVEITVVNNGHPGPFVISVKGSKMMLGRGMADKIMVRSSNYEKDQGRPGWQS
jgi:ferrous iron transport protein A